LSDSILLQRLENAVRNKTLTEWSNSLATGAMILALSTAIGGLLAPLTAAAQGKKDDISFDLVPNPAFVNCLRASSSEEPKAHATVIRGKLNDTLILDLDGIKPGLAFDLFTVERSSLLGEGVADPDFKGSFGLAWYQSDIEIGKNYSNGHVRIRTILLDQIFGFDPDKALPPTNTFHLGFWFNNPQDAVGCGFNPAKPTPFNGEHNAGPLAMISVPEQSTKLGPLCTDPDPQHPGACNP
jgi:hypothetical protein